MLGVLKFHAASARRLGRAVSPLTQSVYYLSARLQTDPPKTSVHNNLWSNTENLPVMVSFPDSTKHRPRRHSFADMPFRAVWFKSASPILPIKTLPPLPKSSGRSLSRTTTILPPSARIRLCPSQSSVLLRAISSSSVSTRLRTMSTSTTNRRWFGSRTPLPTCTVPLVCPPPRDTSYYSQAPPKASPIQK